MHSLGQGELVALTAIATIVLWVVLAVTSANLVLETLYARIMVERYAIVKIGADIFRVIWNSTKYRLIFSSVPEMAKKYPFGRFVPVEYQLTDKEYEDRPLGPIERLLGLRWIGWPFFHHLEGQVLSWQGIGPDGQFLNHENERRTQFAITAQFGIILSGLNVGGDTDHSTPDKEDDEKQRLPIRLLYSILTWTRDPIGSIMGKNWQPQVKARMRAMAQNHLGPMSVDELIGIKSVNENQLQKILQEPDLGTWGVEINAAESSYDDWEIEGDEDGEIKKSLVVRFIGNEQAKAEAKLARAKKAGDVLVIRRMEKMIMALNKAKVDPNTITEAVKAIGVAGFKGDFLGGNAVAMGGKT